MYMRIYSSKYTRPRCGSATILSVYRHIHIGPAARFRGRLRLSQDLAGSKSPRYPARSASGSAHGSAEFGVFWPGTVYTAQTNRVGLC